MDNIMGKDSDTLAVEAVNLRAKVIQMRDDLREHPCWKKYRITTNGYAFKVERHKFLWFWTHLTRWNVWLDMYTPEFNSLEDAYEKIENDIEKRKRQSSHWEVIDKIG